MKTRLLSILAIVLFFLTLKSQPVISLQQFATGTFTRPVDIANAGDDRLFIVQQRGKIFIVQANGSTTATPFLDISNKVIQSGNEQGLLGLVFHPNYSTNGYFYVNYNISNWTTRISRFHVSSNPDVADTSEVILMSIPQPYSNHNAGDLAFGPDGYLYIPLGDGGDAGDPGNRAQDPLNYLGKILRIDVNSGNPYAIPPTNPYIHFASVLNEIWSRGWRNPWRFSFDRLTGDMWVGDVGQGNREEVSFEAANNAGGGNYGWKCYEGNAAYVTTGCTGTYIPPVYDYDNNSIGCSVVGGFVYRGCQYPDLYGYYVFADYCSGRFWTTLKDSSGNFTTTQKLDLGNSNYCTFGEDVNGELYVAGLSDGKIYKIITQASPFVPGITAHGSLNICQGDSLLLVASGGPFNAVTWSTGESLNSIWVKETGDYDVTATDNHACTGISPIVSVTVNDLPPVPTINQSNNDLTVAAQAASYEWYFEGNLLNGITTPSFTPSQSGNYTVKITDSNGCSSISNPFPFVAVGINELQSSGISVRPNPFNENCTISYSLTEKENISIRLYDILGKKKWEMNETQTSGRHDLTIPNEVFQNSGVYFLQISNSKSIKLVRN